MPSEYALGKAAQAWCEEKTSGKVMDTDLAEAFAEVIDGVLSENPTITPKKEIDQLEVQLAGCGVAALGGTKDPAKMGDYGWSPSYQDVLELRLKYEGLLKKVV